MKICIRGLEKFKESGCPENSECPAWISTLGKLQPQPINKCVDLATADLLWNLNCVLNGNGAVLETLRNKICSKDGIKPITLQVVATDGLKIDSINGQKLIE